MKSLRTFPCNVRIHFKRKLFLIKSLAKFQVHIAVEKTRPIMIKLSSVAKGLTLISIKANLKTEALIAIFLAFGCFVTVLNFIFCREKNPFFCFVLFFSQFSFEAFSLSAF